MFPYIDLAGVQRRSVLRPSYFNDVETLTPGFTVQSISNRSSEINARLRKRYGKSLPLGQAAPPLTPSGGTTTPPGVTLSGRPTLGSYITFLQITAGGSLGTALFQWSSDGGLTWNIGSTLVATGTSPPVVSVAGAGPQSSPSQLQVQITTGGALGTAIFKWSTNGGATWTSNVTTAATVALGTTGLTLSFAAGTYSTTDAYTGQGIVTAATVALGTTGMTALFPALGTYDTTMAYEAVTPVVEDVLRWLTVLVTADVADRHGISTTDPLWIRISTRVDTVLKELEEAANSQTGLLDLPINEDEGSAITTGGPLGFSDASPYAWTDRQVALGSRQDGRGGWGRGGC